MVIGAVARTHITVRDYWPLSTNQQPPQRGGAVPLPVWVGSKWLLAFSRVLVTAGTDLAHPFFRRAAT